MARAIDTLPKSRQAEGWNMVTDARNSFSNPSMALGTAVTGVTDAANNAAGNPAGVIPTGSNTTPVLNNGIEAV